MSSKKMVKVKGKVSAVYSWAVTHPGAFTFKAHSSAAWSCWTPWGETAQHPRGWESCLVITLMPLLLRSLFSPQHFHRCTTVEKELPLSGSITPWAELY